MINNKYLLDIPYPKVSVEEKNICYANLLYSNYCGQFSEMTSLCQYIYQHFPTEFSDTRLSEALKCIAMVEMKHFDILGELILLLGGDPIFRMNGCNNSKLWKSDVVAFTTNVKQLLCDNIELEKIALESYRQRLCQISDKGVQKCIERIILDEEHHLQIFYDFYKGLD